MTQPDELGKHAVVTTASIIEMLAEHLLEDHPAIKANPRWHRMAEDTFNAVHNLYRSALAETTRNKRLRDLITEKSFRRGNFTLSSGRSSTYMFDLKPTMLDPTGINLLADAILDKLTILQDHYGPIDAIAGVEMGGIPLISVICAKSYQHNDAIPALIIRQKTKDHGTERLIEGDVESGLRVVLIDDVTTTGQSVAAAITTLEAHGCHTMAVITAVDRLEGAREHLQNLGVTLHPIFTKNDFA